MGWNNQGLESCSTWTTDLSTPCREEGSYMLFVEINFIFHNDIIKYYIYKKKYFSATTSCKMNINEKDWLNDTSTCLLVSSEVYLTIIKIKKTDTYTHPFPGHTQYTLCFFRKSEPKNSTLLTVKKTVSMVKGPASLHYETTVSVCLQNPVTTARPIRGSSHWATWTCVCSHVCVRVRVFVSYSDSSLTHTVADSSTFSWGLV